MAIVRYFNQLRSLDIDTTDDAVSTDVAAILEDMTAESAYSHLHTALRVCVKAMQFQIALNHLCGK